MESGGSVKSQAGRDSGVLGRGSAARQKGGLELDGSRACRARRTSDVGRRSSAGRQRRRARERERGRYYSRGSSDVGAHLDSLTRRCTYH